MDARERLLRERFGLPGFHPWQREAIDELLDGKRAVLVVAPTGGGKSLCYQLPAVELEGTTLVVSPLIALMEDQVRGLVERGIRATWLSSTVEPEERRRREAAMAQGAYDLVYLAPERLAHGAVLELLRKVAPPLIAIDEAHCISQWGHDFRPDYLRLRPVIDALRPRHVLACTATATPLVREEILRNLGMRPQESALVLRGFARPNLHLGVHEIDRSATRRRVALAAIAESLGRPASPAGAAIVYAATRRNSEQVAQAVGAEGWRAAAYHAGLPAETRAEVNRAFAARALDVVVATNAFGMGIDRPDIRAVVHVQAPGSIEAYYQEVGRAGRDGQPALGLLLAGTSDFGLRRRLLDLGVHPDDPTSAAHAETQWRLFLDLMRYVEAGSCRHDFILRYFGDERELLGGCGHCDVCERLEAQGGQARRADEEADALVVRKALSGVARNRLTAGMQAVAEMLHGDDTERLRRMGLTSLTTHGLLAERPKEWIHALLRRLLTAGLIEVTPDAFPKPYLTAAGVAVMRGEREARVLPPPADAGEPRHRRKSRRGPEGPRSPLPASADAGLFERLRAERSAVAKERGVPAYVICHDRTLIEIASSRPASLAELALVHGMGPARLEAYGERLLGVVQAL